MAQLKNAADAAKVHFYSVNSTDSTKGNYNNNGASGADALAAGVGAQAEADHSIAIGTNAHTQDSNGKRAVVISLLAMVHIRTTMQIRAAASL